MATGLQLETALGISEAALNMWCQNPPNMGGSPVPRETKKGILKEAHPSLIRLRFEHAERVSSDICRWTFGLGLFWSAEMESERYFVAKV